MRNKTYAYPNITTPNRPVIFDPEKCTGCNTCVDVCQMDVLIPNPVKANLRSYYSLMNVGTEAAVWLIVLQPELSGSIIRWYNEFAGRGRKLMSIFMCKAFI